MEGTRSFFYLYAIFIFILSHNIVYSIKEYFIADNCLESIGPTEGDVISYHKDARGQWMVPTSNIDCWLLLKGIPSKQGNPQRYVSLGFRRFKMSGYEKNSISNDTCETAYMEVYEAHADGRLIGHPPTRKWKRCGTSSPKAIESTAEALMIHLYVEAPPWATPSANLESFFRRSSSASSDNGTLISPRVDFKADFTSYFLGNCSGDGVHNDANQYHCENDRCVDLSLLCDDLGSANCGDSSDEKPGPPSNCSVVTTVPPPIEEQLTPLWAVLGALATMAALYWCCWRPGYIPWRLARLRNLTCCGKSLSASCKKLTCCSSSGLCGPRGGCFLKCCNSCVGTGSGGPASGVKPKGGTGEVTQRGCCDAIRRRAGGDSGAGTGSGSGKGGAGDSWTNFAFDDGGHVRELR